MKVVNEVPEDVAVDGWMDVLFVSSAGEAKAGLLSWSHLSSREENYPVDSATGEEELVPPSHHINTGIVTRQRD